MTEELRPFDAVLVVSFGGPNGPDDVMPFLRNVAEGRAIPEDRLAAVAEHYDAIGGVSPIVANTDEFVEALAAELRTRGVDVPVRLGNRNWHPFLVDTLRELHADGARRILCLITSAYASYSGCRQYREDLAGALAELGPVGEELELAKIAPFHGSAGWAAAQVEALTPALADNFPRKTAPGGHMPSPAQSTRDVGAHPTTKVLFVTHSIPTAMDQLSGSDTQTPRRTYVEQHLETARLVVEAVDPTMDWELAYCSRSGSPRTPWLEPDAADRIRELPRTDPHTTRVVVVPFGFLNDHMEVRNDLDGDAAAAAAEVGLEFVRVPTAHTQAPFLASLVDRLLARAAEERGEPTHLDALAPEWPTTCAVDCCRLRPDAPTLPTVCQEDTP